MKIILNGVEFKIQSHNKVLSYNEIATFAGKNYDLCPSITYSTRNSQGILTKGNVLELKNNMVINVMYTGNS